MLVNHFAGHTSIQCQYLPGHKPRLFTHQIVNGMGYVYGLSYPAGRMLTDILRAKFIRVRLVTLVPGDINPPRGNGIYTNVRPQADGIMVLT